MADKTIKTTGQNFGVTEAAISVSALDKIITMSLDFYKKALDPKTDYTKLVNSQINTYQKITNEAIKAFRDVKFLAQEAKTKPVAQAGSITKAPQSGEAVANAASLGTEQTNGAVKENSKSRADIERTAADESAEIVRREWELKLKYAGAGAGAMANILQNLYVATSSKNRAMFEAMKAFSIAETIIQTYRAAQGAYAALSSIPVVGPALGAVAAAAAIVSGIARVNAIRKTKPGAATGTIDSKGRANPPYKGGSRNAYPVPQRQEPEIPTQNITVIIHNPLSQQNWAEIAESEIIPAINDAVENRNIHLTVETVD